MSFVIKSIALMILFLLVTMPAHAEPLDQREYMQSRMAIAEVCQDLSFYLRKHPDSEMESFMDECTPDQMEYQAIQQCQKMDVPIPECPVSELMLLYAGVLKEYMR